MIALKNILVATDFGDAAAAALHYGEEFARKFGASLHVLHVVDDLSSHVLAGTALPINLTDVQRQLDAEAATQLSALISEPDRAALRAQLMTITSAYPAATILSYAQEITADLIIVGTHGRQGLSHFFLGSVAQQVSRSASCPVLTVRAEAKSFLRPDALAATHAT